jgi:hypothetical protein
MAELPKENSLVVRPFVFMKNPKWCSVERRLNPRCKMNGRKGFDNTKYFLRGGGVK